MTDAPDWSLSYEGLNPAEIGLREALLTLGNGYFATRGSVVNVDADGIHYPGTYLAGGYNRLETSISGETVENEDLVNMPNWLVLKLRPEGQDWLQLSDVEVLDFQEELKLREGMVTRWIRCRHEEGRITRIVTRRFIHMSEPHYAALEMTLTAENWSGVGEIRSALDGRVTNSGVARYRTLNSAHLEPAGEGGGDGAPIWLRVRTSQSRLEVAEAARTEIYSEDELLIPPRSLIVEPGFVAEDIRLDLAEGNPVMIEKVVALCTSRDRAGAESAHDAREAAVNAPRFSVLARSHSEAWAHLWRRADIRLEDGDLGRATRLLRLHAFHLLQTVSPASIDLDTGAPARGWHGEAYRGHVFWDELFIFPFYNYRFPDIARALLRYRHRRLDAARELARASGFRGAMYPWQSGSSGREESQKLHLNPKSGRWLPDNTYLQRHVNAAVAYNVWQYFQVTSDMDFLERYGAEVILEIARFWSSIAAWDEARGRYVICGVVGPDEYHDAYPDAETPGVDNNAYTNIMAVWTIRAGLWVLERLPDSARRGLCDRLDISDEELALWRDITKKMFVPFHDGGIISQFEGYEALEEFDWAGYRAQYGDIRRLDRILEAEGDTPNRYRLSKQADVLMLFYLLSAEQLTELLTGLDYEFDPASIPKNIAYYLERTSNGSTLSQVVHAWVLARSDRRRAWDLFLEVLDSDVCDVQGGTTAEGIHLGAMAATIDLIQRCFTGLELRDDRLWLNPRLPAHLKGLRVTVLYKGNWFDIHIVDQKLRVIANHHSFETVEIVVLGSPHQIAPGQILEFSLPQSDSTSTTRPLSIRSDQPSEAGQYAPPG